MAKRAAITVALTILAVVLFFVVQQHEDVLPASGQGPQQSVASEPPVALGAVEDGQRVSAIVEREAAPEPPPSQEEGVEQSVEEALAPIHGSVVVTDPEGVEHPGEDGRMRLGASLKGWVDHSEVTIEDGLWSCEVPADARLSVGAIELGGRTAFTNLDQRNDVAVPANGFLAIEARWPPPSILVVRAKDTGLDLDEVQVVGDLRLLEGGDNHPGRFSPDDVLIPSAASPIELATGGLRWSERITLYARRPGYAWGRIEVDLSLGGERILMLGRGGDLRVSFRGHAPAEGTYLSIQLPEERSPAIELPLMDGADVDVESLEEGPYEVVARIGRRFQDSGSVT